MPCLVARLLEGVFQRSRSLSSRRRQISPVPSCIENLEERTLLSVDPLLLGEWSHPAGAEFLAAQNSLRPEVAPGRWIAVLKDGVDSSQFAQELRGRGREVSHIFSHAVRAVAFRGAALRDDPRIASLEPDLILHTAAQTLPTGINRINADLNSLAKIDGLDERVDVDIAILDTGIDVTHPDLLVYAGRNFTGGSELDFDDRHGHGTHVAGTAAALDNGLGVVGVAPGARLWAAKVLADDGNGYLSQIIAGVDWVTANADQIEVANMSLGGTGLSSAFRAAIQRSVAAGVVYVVAAGNSGVDVYGPDKVFGTSDDTLPASYPEVMTISAFGDSDGRAGGQAGSTDDSFASFSNYSTNVISGNPVNSPGAAIDLLMPGVNILSTYKDGQYARLSGTSMAAPHAAGLAALYVSANGRDQDGDGDHDAQDVYAVRQALIDNAVAQNSSNGLATLNDRDPKWENIGWAEDVQTTDDVPTVVITSPNAGATVSGTISLTANATDDNGISKVEFFLGQMSLGQDSDGGNGWSIAWDTMRQANGSYVVTAVATDTAGQTANHGIGLTVENGVVPTFAVGFDFGSSTSPVAADYVQVVGGKLYDGSAGYGWTSKNWTGTSDRGGADPLTRDSVVSQAGVFAVDVPSAIYDVTLTLGDAVSAVDQVNVALEGETAGIISASAGKHISQTYRVEVADGQLTIDLRDLGGASRYYYLNAIRVQQVTDTEPPGDTMGPKVVSSDALSSEINTLDGFRLTFSETIPDGGLQLSHMTLMGPNGSIPLTSLARISATVFDVRFPVQSAAGLYTLTLAPLVTDQAGNLLDQDGDGTGGEADQDRFQAIAELFATDFQAGFDFGATSSPVAEGFQQVTPGTGYDSAKGYGWVSSQWMGSSDRGGANALTRDSVISQGATFAVDVANGIYDVTVTIGDLLSVSDNLSVSLETQEAGVISAASGEHASATFRVEVTDGQLTIKLLDLGGVSRYFYLNGIEVRRI